jgi:hypothetical protein
MSRAIVTDQSTPSYAHLRFYEVPGKSGSVTSLVENVGMDAKTGDGGTFTALCRLTRNTSVNVLSVTSILCCPTFPDFHIGDCSGGLLGNMATLGHF